MGRSRHCSHLDGGVAACGLSIGADDGSPLPVGRVARLIHRAVRQLQQVVEFDAVQLLPVADLHSILAVLV